MSFKIDDFPSIILPYNTYINDNIILDFSNYCIRMNYDPTDSAKTVFEIKQSVCFFYVLTIRITGLNWNRLPKENCVSSYKTFRASTKTP